MRIVNCALGTKIILEKVVSAVILFIYYIAVVIDAPKITLPH